MKEGRSCVIVDDICYYFIGEFKPVIDVVGTEIVVEGVVVEKHWPMFIMTQEMKDGGLVPQGMPMPPGTDFEKESRYFAIESPTWRLK